MDETKVCTHQKEPGKKQHQKAYQIVKYLTTQRQDKNSKSLTEKEEILARWMEYCSELYSHRIDGDLTVLHCKEPSHFDNCLILCSEVKAAIKFLKKGKATEADNILARLVQSGGDTLIDILTIICGKIWQSGEWPMGWTQSLVITVPKKGNLHLCQNYCIITLMSH